MRVVCDAGPLIHYPASRYQEVAIRGKGEDGSNELVQATWIQQRHPRRSSLVAALAKFLGSDEAEAIALAGERPHTLLLIDETHGRRVARNMRITIRGTLGILLQGFRAGSVPDLEAAIFRMRERGTWIADDLVAAILAPSRRR